MIKIIITAFITIFALLSACIIVYWRDISYQPTGWDLLTYLLILPVLVTAVALMPYLILKAVKYFNEKQKNEEQQRVEAIQQVENLEKKSTVPELKSRAFSLNIFSASALHSFGENAEILEHYKQFKSPELDSSLCNAYGLPVLSFRIHALDALLEHQDDEKSAPQSIREQRIFQLINQQLEQHTEVLYAATEHLKDSAMFYESELAYQYRMHPAWQGEPYDELEISEEPVIQPISRLNQLYVHVLLPEDLIHQHNDQVRAELMSSLAEQYSILEAQIEVEYYFISQQSAYLEWLKLLEQISQYKYCFNLVISVDSEIDQECLDEKFWQDEQYIAAEYAASWCLAPIDTAIKNLIPQKTLKISLDETSANRFIKQNNLEEHQQFEYDEPFIFILDDIQDFQKSKKIRQKFLDTIIETHHFLYTQQNTGHTQQLAKIFNFMLGMHLSEELKGLIFSADCEDVYAVFDDYQALMNETEINKEESAYL